ncbi:MAG: hypothetical protein Pars2KO_12360 [Parasphingorhabdus sp.]
MKQIQRVIAVTLLASGLSACMATTPPVEVTRFHTAQDQQFAFGSVEVVSAQNEADSNSLEQGTYAAAVMRELQTAGFADAGNLSAASEYVARMSVDRFKIDAAGSRRSPVSVGVGGSTGSYRSGIGLGIGINLGGRPKNKVGSELSVRISRRSDDTVVWEGRSYVEAKENSPAAQPGLAASKLAEALFRDFPGQSGETIRVP